MSDEHKFRAMHQAGYDELNHFWEKIDDLDASIEEFSATALGFVEKPLERTLEKIRAFEPSVSVIGQVKAGKSTLLNALIGETDLLPSDVNPWTSVITSIHLNSRQRPHDTSAVFRFFDSHEWDRLVATGGRLGEMAARAGFETEAEDVREQVNEMRETTEARLGADFEKLLGGSHAYPDLDRDTINRYICYGDPEELEEGSAEGVYADLTKSADLYLDLPGYPKRFCLRDTPGVNDTFMMREQITLNAISDSRVCVIVLSAHQALTTTDLALLRIICSVDAREVIIFVNRIDELTDPDSEKTKIAESIRATLSRLDLTVDIQILFGSGYWAKCALEDNCAKLRPHSRAALEAFVGDRAIDYDDPETLRLVTLGASGVSTLHRAITKRVIEGPGQAFLTDIQKELDAILAMNDSVASIAERQGGTGAASDGPTAKELRQRIDTLRDQSLAGFAEAAGGARARFQTRLLEAQESFVETALDALRSTEGSVNTWNHDPSGLRMTMKSAYTSACSRLRRDVQDAFDTVMDGARKIIETDMGILGELGEVESPEPPQPRAPTIIASTISLDLQAPWWRRFWTFGSRKKMEKRYRTLILQETTPLIEDLVSEYFDPLVTEAKDQIASFADDRAAFVAAILECVDTGTSGNGRSAA